MRNAIRDWFEDGKNNPIDARLAALADRTAFLDNPLGHIVGPLSLVASLVAGLAYAWAGLAGFVIGIVTVIAAVLGLATAGVLSVVAIVLGVLAFVVYCGLPVAAAAVGLYGAGWIDSWVAVLIERRPVIRRLFGTGAIAALFTGALASDWPAGRMAAAVLVGWAIMPTAPGVAYRKTRDEITGLTAESEAARRQRYRSYDTERAARPDLLTRFETWTADRRQRHAERAREAQLKLERERHAAEQARAERARQEQVDRERQRRAAEQRRIADVERQLRLLHEQLAVAESADLDKQAAALADEVLALPEVAYLRLVGIERFLDPNDGRKIEDGLPSLDLHGYDRAGAQRALQKAADEAIAAGLDRFRVIVGSTGTTLRSVVRNWSATEGIRRLTDGPTYFDFVLAGRPETTRDLPESVSGQRWPDRVWPDVMTTSEPPTRWMVAALARIMERSMVQCFESRTDVLTAGSKNQVEGVIVDAMRAERSELRRRIAEVEAHLSSLRC